MKSVPQSDFTAVIPVAGKGARLLPFTEHCPKTMLSVAGRPILAHILEQVESCGISKVVLVVGYQKQAVIDFITANYAHLQVRFVEQTQPNGPGDAIYAAKDVVDGPLLIVWGDTIVEGDLRQLVADGRNCVGVKRVEDPKRFGIVEFKDGKIAALEEKPAQPKTNIALIGAYAIIDHALLFDCLREVTVSGRRVNGEVQLTDALDCMLQKGAQLVPVPMYDWFDCGTIETLLSTNRALLARQKRVPRAVAKKNKIIPPCFVDPTAVVENCVLGPYVAVAAGAKLADSTLEDVIVGPGSVVACKNLKHQIIDRYTS